MCRTSLVFPKQSVLRISVRSTNLTSLTIMQSKTSLVEAKRVLDAIAKLLLPYANYRKP